MGMFDSFYNVPIKCPKCGRDLSGEDFQTKDLECVLDTYYFPCYVDDKFTYIHIYTSCPKCKTWVEPKVILENGFTIRLETAKGVPIWELDPIETLSKISNEREFFRQESLDRKSFAIGLAAFIWKHHKGKRSKLFKLLKSNLDESKGDFEKYSVRSCYNPGSYIAGIIGGPQNYCWVLEGKNQDEVSEEMKKYGKILNNLPVGKERNEMIYALVWTEKEGIVEKGTKLKPIKWKERNIS